MEINNVKQAIMPQITLVLMRSCPLDEIGNSVIEADYREHPVTWGREPVNEATILPKLNASTDFHLVA